MSTNKNRSGPQPRIAILAIVGVIGSIILLASGCGGGSTPSGSPSSSPGASSNIAKDVAFANCMRAHGADVTVGSNGTISGSSGSSGSQQGAPQAVQAAQNACRHLLPNGGQPSQAQQEAKLKQALEYTQCMRSHGVPNFPDPTSNGTGNYGYRIPNGSGIDSKSAAYQKANQACESIGQS
jgi:hypothetical protein